MKTITRAGVIALITILGLAGCYISLDRGVGEVGIRLPSPRRTEGVAPADFGRVYVMNGPTLLSIGEATDWEEFDLQPDDGTEITEITVGPVPAESAYRVVLVFGNYQTGVGGVEVFVPVQYAASNEFTVYGGQTNVAEMTLESSPFVPLALGDTLGRTLLGIVFDGTSAHVATSEAVYSTTGIIAATDFATDTLTFPTSRPVPADRTINSISLGATDELNSLGLNAPTVWVNTTKGLLPLEWSTADGELAFNDDFDVSSLGPEFSVADFSILDSGGYLLDNGVGGTDVYGYVQFDGGLSGVWDPDTGGFSPQWLVPIDLSAFVVGRPIYDLEVYFDGLSVDALVASKLGAFRMSQEVLDPANEVYSAERLFAYSDFFEISIDGKKATITEIAVGDQNDTAIYLGTPRGAVRVPDVNQIGQTLELTGELVPFTSNQIVEDIVQVDNYLVVLTNHFLVYSNDGGDNFDRIPVYASSAGTVSGLLLIPTEGIVVLAGENGLVGVNISN